MGGDKIPNNRKLELLEILHKHLRGLDAWIAIIAQLDLDKDLKLDIERISSVQEMLELMMIESEKNQRYVSLWMKELKKM